MIIGKYKDKGILDHVFPIIQSKELDEDEIYKSVKAISIKVNNFLKCICKELGVEERVTWSSGRSSFISKLIDEGFHPLL